MTPQGLILAVDDTPASLKLLTDILHGESFEVRSAIDGALALHAAQLQPPDLILLDASMPNMDGFEVCRQLKADPRTRDIPIIFVSALTDTAEKLKGFELGAVDYVTKPFQREELLARVRNHLELRRLRQHLEEMVEERTESLRASQAKLKDSLFESITAIAATVEMRDPYTAGHQRRVATIAVAIAQEMGLSEELAEGLHLAGSVHDVGKIKIPAEILTKPGRLSPIEYDLIKEHPQAGHDILKGIDFPWPVARIVLQHHERLDGSGYPQGLAGGDILLEARILAVADVIDAMASFRPYRASLGIEFALQEIEQQRGVLFDPVVVDSALRLFRGQGFHVPEYHA
ncbi:MAG: two-component system response regulator [Alphaproteobacteria bacterium CG_4_10_14_0_2_um_filter_63_37]|nr:MAG: two-component system response regulator [Proteobacteria bacterium CG1_02_64_396]PJA24845.1 MAG: two-component system response regulator [Alphaproteobacteria bacterium CG_4_10_14_0_2_um_filter_63_37]